VQLLVGARRGVLLLLLKGGLWVRELLVLLLPCVKFRDHTEVCLYGLCN
jgi:hypothetical protein